MNATGHSDRGAMPPASNYGHPPMKKASPVPLYLQRPKRSILKVSTLDESLHATWESSPPKPAVKNVEFKEIEVREYERTVGDNPSCSSGPPLTIGWKFWQRARTSVDWYEKARPARKSQFELVMPREARQEMLIVEWRISQAQIATAVRSNIRTKNQRRRTVNNLGRLNKLEEGLESLMRKLMRLVTFQKRPSKQVEEMTKKSLMVEEERRAYFARMDTENEAKEAAHPQEYNESTKKPPAQKNYPGQAGGAQFAKQDDFGGPQNNRGYQNHM